MSMQIQEPSIERLVIIFDELFLPEENTRLQIGAKEPFYQAAKAGKAAVIFSRQDYFSSALHEIAHWTIAGAKRRQQDDFGYWYAPEGRSEQQQLKFEQVEVKPQAVEWLLSLACRQVFNLSADNLSQNTAATVQFEDLVYKQMLNYFESGLPVRADKLSRIFCDEFRAGKPLSLNELMLVNV